jgi:hypothetical protein
MTSGRVSFTIHPHCRNFGLVGFATLTRIVCEKMSEDKEIYTRIIGYMNEQRPETLLLFAWNLFGYVNASQAVMTSIDAKSFTLQIKNQSFIPMMHKTVMKTYNFNPPLLNASESRDRLVRLSDKYSYCPFPSGGGPYITIMLWLTIIFGIIQAKELLQYEWIRWMHEKSMSIFGSPENAAYALALVIILHSLELVYMLYIFRNLKLPSDAKQSWINKMLFLGVPVTMLAWTLTSVTKKQSKKTV